MTPDLKRKLERALRDNGGLYTLQDIFDCIERCEMQSFAVNDTWVVTQVLDFPRRRVLNWVLVVGHGADMHEVERLVTEFAENAGATLIRAIGRTGWDRFVERKGWKKSAHVYTKEL